MPPVPPPYYPSSTAGGSAGAVAGGGGAGADISKSGVAGGANSAIGSGKVVSSNANVNTSYGPGGASGGGGAAANSASGAGNTKSGGSRRSSSGKTNTSRSYPRGVGLDFRKLAGPTLLHYIDHHGVSVRSEAPPSELAVAVARNFEQMEVDEDECIGGFLERLEKGSNFFKGGGGGMGSGSSGPSGGGSGGGGPGGTGKGGSNSASDDITFTSSSTDYARKSAFFNGYAPAQLIRKRRRSKWAARPGEQVAAKVTRTDENGSWILASVQRFYAESETYDVQDEDDTSKLIRLPWNHVMRLSTGVEGCFHKGIDCMAIFPETTSFYRAKISKSPIWKLDRSNVPMVKEIIVKFDDDEDGSTGRTPHRRVPSRYVIPIPKQYFYDETDDFDLSPPTSANEIK